MEGSTLTLGISLLTFAVTVVIWFACRRHRAASKGGDFGDCSQFCLATERSPAVAVPSLIEGARKRIRVVQYKVSAKGARKALRDVLRNKPSLRMDLLLDQEVAVKKSRHWDAWKVEFGERVCFYVPRSYTKMHAKIIIVDDCVAFLGSSNMTNGG